ncbi:MAG TPA: MFS transporter [Trebonia sp.]|jgi:predicted MFS family arabinose efflux permease|nr:MFS transporter [Trebonia sp.]
MLTLGRLRDIAVDAAGGPARARVALILAAVLGLNGADTGTISSTANNLEHTFGVGNTQIGLLLTVVGVVGAAFTIPAGILTDRTRRTWLLSGSIAMWAVATLVSGFATSYLWMVLARVALGVVTATTGPAIASLTGDYFPAADRARMYGLILGGDLVGSGFGYLVSGELSTMTTWRASFWWLAVPSLALAWVVWRLPEPARGGFSRIAPGEEEIRDERDVAAGDRQDEPAPDATGQEEPGQEGPGLAERALRHTDVEPQKGLVLREDPTDRSLWWAVRYILGVRTNVVIIIASALGYFFFAGLRTFAIIFATGHYGISKSLATVLILVIGAGALAGVYVGGRFADRLLRRGHIRARVLVPAVCLLALTPVLAPAIATRTIALALPLLILGSFLLGAPNPPLDAARLDIIHPRLWGRAEGIRTALRSLGEAAAPLLFGYVSQYVFGGPGSSAGSGGTSTPAQADGLEYTFLIFLIPLIIAGLLSLAALRTYPRDVATAAESAKVIGRGG